MSPLFHRIGGQTGELPDIVVEAGGLGSSDDWQHTLPLLERHARVLRYDRAGLGSSPADGAGYSAAAVTARLSALLDRAGFHKPVLLAGYSLGGLYARHFAAVHPQRVAGLVLLDATPVDHVFPTKAMRNARRILRLLHWVARSGLATLARPLLGRGTSPARFRQQVATLAARDYLTRMYAELEAMSGVQAEVRAIASTPRHPVMAILAGTRPAQMTDAEFAHMQTLHRALEQASPGPLSRLSVIAAANHGSLLRPIHATEVAEQVLAFARSLPPPAHREHP